MVRRSMRGCALLFVPNKDAVKVAAGLVGRGCACVDGAGPVQCGRCWKPCLSCPCTDGWGAHARYTREQVEAASHRLSRMSRRYDTCKGVIRDSGLSRKKGPAWESVFRGKMCTTLQ